MTMIPQISQITDDLLDDHPSQGNSMIHDLQQRHWLEWGELVSLLSSALGSVVVALSGQAIYGVAPLTVALSFNTANRYRLAQQLQVNQAQMVKMEQSVQQLELNTVKVILGLQQQLVNEIESLQQKLQEIPQQAALKSAHTTKEVAILRESIMQMQDQIVITADELKQQFKQHLDSQLVAISEPQHSLQIQLVELEDTIQKLRQNILSQKQKSQLNQLLTENQAVIKPHLKRLILVVKQLQAAKTKSLTFPASSSTIQSNSTDSVG